MKFYIKEIFDSRVALVKIYVILSDFTHDDSPKFFHGYVVVSDMDDIWILDENDNYLFKYTDQANMVPFSDVQDRDTFIVEKIKEIFLFEFKENVEE